VGGGHRRRLLPSVRRQLGIDWRDGGVIFIPPQLAEQVVRSSEITRLRDEFGHARLRAKVYTAGQIDGRWTDAIEADFTQWLRQNIDRLPVARAQIEEILKQR
jgi:hypothetical protein